MAEQPPPYFSPPSLAQYQRAQREAAMKNAGSDPWAQMAAGGGYDLARAIGYVTPEERFAKQAEMVAAEAETDATSSDPTEHRLEALQSMARRFNALGMHDYVAKVVPEIMVLQQRQQEMRKLTAEAGKLESDARVASATEEERTAKPGLENEETKANTAQSNASAAESQVDTQLRRNEGQNYISRDGKTTLNVSKMDEATRSALRSQGWTEYGASVVADKPGGLGADKVQEREWDDAAAATASSLRQMAELKQLVIKNPGAWTAGGKVTAAVGRIAQNIKYSLKQRGMTDEDLRTTQEGASAEKLLYAAGIADAKKQAMVLDLAYAAARVRDPGGRLSNQDVDMAVRIVKGQSPIEQMVLIDNIAGRTYTDTMIKAGVQERGGDDPGVRAIEEAKRVYDKVNGLDEPQQQPRQTSSGATWELVEPNAAH